MKASRSSPGTEIGKDIPGAHLLDQFDAIVLCDRRDAPPRLAHSRPRAQGNSLRDGVSPRQHQEPARFGTEDGAYINAKDKRVIVIGGGDTGTDCIGTSLRHGCKSLVNFEIVPMPPERARGQQSVAAMAAGLPRRLRTCRGGREIRTRPARVSRSRPSSFRETTRDGCRRSSRCVSTGQSPSKAGLPFTLVDGSEEIFECDLVLLAMGFLGPETLGFRAARASRLDPRANYKADYGKFRTNVDKVFAAGDCRRGQSLIVWAINEGRGAARECDRYLMGSTELP